MYRKTVLILLTFVLALGIVQAQYGPTPNHNGKPSRDYIILKKRYKTIRSYMAGSWIVFQQNNGQWVEGTITTIANDSIWMKDQKIQLVAAGFGSKVDTVTFNYRKLAVSDIMAMPKEKESWAFIKNGILFKLAGAGYIGLNVINGLGKNADPLFGSENLPKLLTAAGVYAFGTVLGWLHKPDLKIGKKYRIQYVSM